VNFADADLAVRVADPEGPGGPHQHVADQGLEKPSRNNKADLLADHGVVSAVYSAHVPGEA
jgi:hypothetical protein